MNTQEFTAPYVHNHWHRYLNPIGPVRSALTTSQKPIYDDCILAMGRRNFLTQTDIARLKEIGADLIRRGVLTSYGI